jgi:hypothetical protein
MSWWTVKAQGQISADDDRDDLRNVGFIQTPDAADSPRRLHRTLYFLTFTLGTVMVSVFLKETSYYLIKSLQ